MKKSIGKFVFEFEELLEKFIPHVLKVRKQREYLEGVKNNLDSDTAVVVMDFAEQYSCIVQDQAQSYKFNSEEVSLHVSCITYLNENGLLESKHHVLISDPTKHDANSVNLSQLSLVNAVKTCTPTLKKIIYFTDGAPEHYKNKFNFENITFHKEDFGIECEWHMFPTSHGKTTCDGVAGNVKRRAREESIRNKLNPITNGREFFDFLIRHKISLKMVYSTFWTKIFMNHDLRS